MKGRINKKGLLFLPVVVVLVMFLVFTDDGQSTEGLNDSFELEFEQVNEFACDENEENCEEINNLSILDDQPKIASSDDPAVQKFLDELGLSDKKAVGIETVAVKYDLAGNSKSSSTILPVTLSLEEADGFLIDNIQVAFFAVTQETFGTINVEGTVDFFLDEKKIQTKKIYASTALDGVQTPLVVVNKVPPPLGDRPETFDFTFTDEGFVNDSVHSFKVVIRDVKGDVNSKNFEFEGSFIAYDLKLKVDESKITQLSEDGQVVTVNKTDSQLVVCSATDSWYSRLGKTIKIPPSMSERVTVTDKSGKVLIDIQPFKGGSFPLPQTLKTDTIFGKLTCNKMSGLERGQEVIVKVGGFDFPINLPLSQHNITFEYRTVCKGNCIQGDGNTADTYRVGISNLDYKFSSQKWCDANGQVNPDYGVFSKRPPYNIPC